LRVGAHFRIFLIRQDGFALGDPFFQIFVLAIFLDDRRKLTVSLGSLLVLGGIADDFGRGQRSRQFLITSFDLV
jgi:hypothetical protein